MCGCNEHRLFPYIAWKFYPRLGVYSEVRTEFLFCKIPTYFGLRTCCNIGVSCRPLAFEFWVQHRCNSYDIFGEKSAKGTGSSDAFQFFSTVPFHCHIPSFLGLINADRWTDGQTDESNISRGQLKCDGTRAETRFRLSAKRTSPFKSAGGVSSVAYWQ